MQVSKATARRATLLTGEAELVVDEREEEQLRRELPEPTGGAEKPALSGDGAMVHPLCGEGVEGKTVALGEVTGKKRGESCRQHLSSFSRRCDATRFAQAALLETHRRGLERAKQVCAVQEGAQWLPGLTDAHRAHAVRMRDAGACGRRHARDR